MARAGIDLGATNLRAAVADGDGELLGVERRETPRDTDGQAVARTAARTLEAAAASAGRDMAALEAVGVGTIGPLDRSAGTVIRPPNLPGVDRIPLKDVLVALVGHPRVYVENDAVAALAGERASGDAPPENLVYLTLSTGIGAGVAVDGRVLRGRAGNAAEVGHLVVEPGGRTCGCGATGHWEAYCSGSAIPEFTRELAESAAIETELPVEAGSFSAADVYGAADEDPLADRVVAEITRYNAIGVADLVHAYAPDRIAVGGAVALENPSAVIEPLADAVGSHTMLSVPEIDSATHGHDAVLRGALALAAADGLDP